MDPNSGRVVQAYTREEASITLGIPEPEVVMLEGTPEQIEIVSRRVKLGAAEEKKRRARRKNQRAARKRNR